MDILEMPPSQGWNRGGRTSPIPKRTAVWGGGTWVGALHAHKVSSRWKVQRFHVRSQWLGLLQERRKRLSYFTSPRECV